MTFRVKAFRSGPVFLARLLIFTSMFIVLSTTMSLIFSGSWSAELAVDLVLYSIIFVHHLISLLGPFKYFYGAIDFVLVVGEAIGYVKLNGGPGPLFAQTVETFTLYLTCVWIIYGCLSFLVPFRLVTIFETRGKALTTPFEVLYDKHDHPHIQEHFLYRILGGRYSTRTRILGENNAITVFRSLCGFALMEVLAFFAIMKVILEPLQETNLGPIREFRSTLPHDPKLENSTTWNLLFPLDANESGDPKISRDTLESIMKIEVIWDQDGPQCTWGGSPSIPEYSGVAYYQFICPSSALNHTLPTLLLTVDFSLLPATPLLSNSSLPMNSLSVVIGMTNDTYGIQYIMQNTHPTLILPGNNNLALVVPDVREVFARRSLAALGVFQRTTGFFEAQISTSNDPWISTSGTNKGSLRIIRQQSWANLRVIRDYRQTSVISGFSGVGGLWTIFSGIFSFMFGMTMLRFLSGSKPLAIVGVVHSFRKESIKEEALALYPKIREEHENEENRGLLALIRDNLLDVSFLEKRDEEHSSSVDEERFPEDRENNLTNPGTALALTPLETSTEPRRGDGDDLTNPGTALALLPLETSTEPRRGDGDEDEVRLLPH